MGNIRQIGGSAAKGDKNASSVFYAFYAPEVNMDSVNKNGQPKRNEKKLPNVEVK